MRTALRLDTDDLRARALTVVCLRALGHAEEAAPLLRGTLALDPLDQLARTLDGRDPADPFARIDAALDLASFGETAEAERLLARSCMGAPAPEGAGSAAAP
uniref:hypothetical protein n=1 Tax=Rathayibacter sp. VKM Ac-2630 TaxID=1938617 RepID=UPI0031584C56